MHISNQKGMTLLETLIALSILVTGIFATLGLLTSTLSFSQRSEQEITVVNLAREGIELVRSIRENSGFDALIEGNYVLDSDTYSDLTEPETTAICGAPCDISNCTNCQLLLSGDGRYVHDSGDQTIFYRMLKISPKETWKRKIISQVYWSERGRSHSFTLEDHLTDWRDDGS